MANYNAGINIVVSGQDRLNNVLNSVEKLNAITAKLKPINLLAPGAGAGGDAIRIAKKSLDDFARAVVNFKPEGIQKRAKELSNTLAGAAGQANVLGTALANVGLKSGGFKQQTAEVQNYALALDAATRNAARLDVINQAVQRGARVQNIATRFNVSPEKVEQRLANIREAAAKRQAQLDAAEQKRIVQKNALLKSEGAIRQRNAMMQNALIGGAFPLLFGGGAGAVAGGFAGGFIPGNPMMSIVTSALGTMVDQFVASVAEMGVAVTSTSGTFELMREKALFSSKAVEDQAIALEEQGKVTELADLLTQDLAKSIGGEGVRALQALGDETNILTKEWNLLTAQLFALVAGPLAAFINALNTVLGGVTTENRLNTLRKEATPAQQKRIAEITAEERGGEFKLRRGGGIGFEAGPESAAVAERILKRTTAEGIVPPAPPGRVTSEDRRTITAPTDRASDKAAKDAARLAERLRGLAAETQLTEKITALKQLQFNAEMAGDKQTQIRLAGEEKILKILHDTRSQIDGTVKLEERLAILKKTEGAIAIANQETAQEMARLEAERTRAFDAIIADLNLELALKTATTEQERERLRIEAARAKLQADLKGQGFDQTKIDQITGLQAQVAAPLTDVQKIDQHIGKLKTEIDDLTSISNIAIKAAEGIGAAFANSFSGLISGSMTAKEALGSFFKSVGEMFIEMAAEIIAKQMVMITLQLILKALGAIGGGGGGGGTVTADFMNTEALKGLTPAAKGATFSNGIAKFARGGIVGSPTLFKFADGGTTRTGLMGEAGPEAIMPLKRGADGSLGVQANGLRDAMNQGRAAGGGTPVLNMSFQSTTINGVEYVSREQLEQAMAATRRDATRDGASRGMTMTLDKLQQSPSTRRKVGI